MTTKSNRALAFLYAIAHRSAQYSSSLSRIAQAGIRQAILATFMSVLISTLAVAAPAPSVRLMKVPDGGIQPQAVMDSEGVLHLLYYKGEPKSGNLFYVRKSKGRASFSKPLQVNSIGGSATSNACISGGQLAVGKNGDVFVTWNASGAVKDRDYVVFYTRLVGDHKAFEPQRNLLKQRLFIDGGGSVAADSNGNVYVFWHAWTEGKSEADGRVYLAKSDDEGKTFADARPIDAGLGTCACCSMKASLAVNGNILVLYRAAEHSTKRDTILLTSNDGGRSFASKIMQSWDGNSCPMTLFSFAPFGDDSLASWESPGVVNIASVKGADRFPRIEAGKSSKYPTIAVDRNGAILLSWIEKEAWNKPGEARWQTFDEKGTSTSKICTQKGIDVWSFTSAIPDPDGGFVLLH